MEFEEFRATSIVDGDRLDRFKRCSARIKHTNNASDLHKSKAHCPWSVSLLDVTIRLCRCSEYEACSEIYFISLWKRRATRKTLSFYIKRFVYSSNVHLATDDVSASGHDENAQRRKQFVAVSWTDVQRSLHRSIEKHLIRVYEATLRRQWTRKRAVRVSR